jgi:hypothetical protein
LIKEKYFYVLDLQREFIEMVRNSRKHREYYKTHSVQLGNKKRAYRAAKQKAKRQKDSPEAQLDIEKEREAMAKSSRMPIKQEVL